MYAGQVNVERPNRNGGWVANPAVTDNCIQLGPMTGAIEALLGKNTESATRVVGGVAAFCSQQYPERGQPFVAAERAPSAADGSIYTSHWLLHARQQPALAIHDLQVIHTDMIASCACMRVEPDRRWKGCSSIGNASWHGIEY